MNEESLRRAAVRSSWIAVVFLVAACGGGGGSSNPSPTPPPPPPPPPAPVTLSGIVIGGAGAIVCVDANGNGACDAGETTTSADAQGAFTLTGLTATPAAGIAVTASIPAGAGGATYTLKAPASKASVISPITSLIQAGVAQGMTLVEAEAVAALQLQVNAANLYSNYATTPSSDSSALTVIGAASVVSLRDGVPLVLGALTTRSPDYTVRRFNYTNAQTFDVRHYYWTNVPNVSTGLYPFYVVADVLSNGLPRSAVPSTYVPQWVSTASGWVPSLNEANAHASTNGSPSIAIWGNGYRYVSTREDVDVSGQSIASVATQAQSLALNTESTLIGVTANQLNGTMPTGAKVRRIRHLTVEAALSYRPSDGAVGNGATTVAGLPAAFSMPATPTQSNTLSLGNTRAPLGCVPASGTVCTGGALRASFSAGNVINYYLCDLDTATQASSNCVAAGSGTYTVGTALDNTTPMMSFTNLPASSTQTASARTLIQRNNSIYVGTRGLIPGPVVTTRLNRVAFETLATALGITPPTLGAAISPQLGLWSTTYTGTTSGTCSHLLVDAFGAVSGTCTTSTATTFYLGGNVSSTGTANFNFASTAFAGSFLATAASGTWNETVTGDNGTWVATKQ